jgi:hypothetical protein
LQRVTGYVYRTNEAKTIESPYHNDSSAAYLFIPPNGGENPELGIFDYTGEPEGVASSQGASIGLGFGTLVFPADHGGSDDGPLNTHLAKTTTHEVGHLLGTGRADDGQQYVIDEGYSGAVHRTRTERAHGCRFSPTV